VLGYDSAARDARVIKFQALRTLHRLRLQPALVAASGGFLAYLVFLVFIWSPLLGTVYAALPTTRGR
jgi:hypothetical protein